VASEECAQTWNPRFGGAMRALLTALASALLVAHAVAERAPCEFPRGWISLGDFWRCADAVLVDHGSASAVIDAAERALWSKSPVSEDMRLQFARLRDDPPATAYSLHVRQRAIPPTHSAAGTSFSRRS
jgi:hypothetical protein